MEKRLDDEKRISLSPVTLSSGSEHSKHSSVSPPKNIGCLTKSLDGNARLPLDHRPLPNHSSSLQRPRNMYQTRKYRSRSHSRDQSPPNRYRRRSRSRSQSRLLPKGYRSRSRGRSSRNRRSRSRSKSFRNRRSRSQSQGRQYRNRRLRSHSSSRPTRSRRSNSRSVSYANSSSRRFVKSRSRSRSREYSRKRYKSKSPSLKSGHRDESMDMRKIWETFQAEMSALEVVQLEEEKLYDKDPEKHPDYKLEWKKFYKSRVQDILIRGDDPKLHNFESEWAYFWKFRMNELLKADYERKKVALKRRLKLPDDAKPPLYLQDKDNKNAVDIGIPSSHVDEPSPKRVGISQGLISTLRIVTAVEEQLGSLGPKVNGLLSEGVLLQRISGGDPDSLLSNPENFVLLETVKEKLLGQIQSNIVKKSLELAVEDAITSISVLLKCVTPRNPFLFHNQLCASGERSLWSQGCANDSQVNVPGIGEVDRVAIAQQIAEALIKQGKTDVTEAELQELVNGVVGMVEAQAAQERERQIASLKESLQIQEPVRTEVAVKVPEEKKLVQETPITAISLDLKSVAPSAALGTPSIPDPPVLTKNPLIAPKGTDALNMLMSVVKSGIKKTEPVEKSHGWSSDDSNEPIIKSTPASTHLDKNPESDSEKPNKDEKLNLKVELNRTTETLRGMPSSESQGILTAFSKKETPKWCSQIRKSPSPEIFKSMKKKVLLASAKGVNERKVVFPKKSLSPFSTREETSNPLPNSDEEDEDLKVIGAWDSDSDIDLDSFGKTKGLAYDKINVKRLSPDKYEKNLSLLNKSKEVLQNTVVVTPGSVVTDINLDAAIDNLMGELKNKTSKIEVISSKPQPVAKQPQNIIPSMNNVGQPGRSGQQITSQMPTNKVVTTQGYSTPYCYPQPSYGAVQPGYYNTLSMPGYTQGGAVPYYTGNQGATASGYYSNSGNLVYCPTNAQWQSYYGSQQTNMPSNLGSGANYGKY